MKFSHNFNKFVKSSRALLNQGIIDDTKSILFVQWTKKPTCSSLQKFNEICRFDRTTCIELMLQTRFKVNDNSNELLTRANFNCN